MLDTRLSSAVGVSGDTAQMSAPGAMHDSPDCRVAIAYRELQAHMSENFLPGRAAVVWGSRASAMMMAGLAGLVSRRDGGLNIVGAAR
jgi:hypothetical protein